MEWSEWGRQDWLRTDGGEVCVSPRDRSVSCQPKKIIIIKIEVITTMMMMT